MPSLLGIIMDLQNLFPQKLNVGLNTEVFSDSIRLNSSGKVIAVSQNVKILISGKQTVSPASFSSQDSIALSLQSSDQYSDQSHGVVKILLNSGEESIHIFSCVTLADLKFDDRFKDLIPFEYASYPDDSAYIPNNVYNHIVQYSDLSDDIPDGEVKDLNKDSILASTTDNLDTIIICSFYDEKLYRISISDSKIVGIIQISGKPYSAIALPKTPLLNPITNLWVTIYDKNKVIVIDENDAVVNEFSVGNGPLGMASDGDGENVYVANSVDNTVTHLKWNVITSGWDITTIDVGNKPFEVACDTQSSAWITCAADNQVYKITSDDIVTSYVVGENPRGIAYNSGKIWVAISQEQKVVALDLDGNVVFNLTGIGALPFAIASVPLPIALRTYISDILTLTDVFARNAVDEALTIIDAAKFNSITEVIELIERVDRNALTDTISFSERVSYIPNFDVITLQDAMVSNSVLESITLTEEFKIQVDLGELLDNVTISDSISRNAVLEAFSLTDSISINYQTAIDDSIVINDGVSTSANITQNISDSVSLTDTLDTTYVQPSTTVSSEAYQNYVTLLLG